MGIFKTSTMECDHCCELLADNDGQVTGNEKYILEKAHLAGWSYGVRDGAASEGWYCVSCMVKLKETDHGA